MRAARMKSPSNQGASQHTRWSHTHTHHKTAQQSSGGLMDRYRKTEGSASSEPAFNVSQVFLRVTGVSLALPVSFWQLSRLSSVKAVHAWNTMMSPVVQ